MVELVLSTHMGSRGTLAEWSPVRGLVWPKFHCGCAEQRGCGLAPCRRGGEGLEERAWRRHREPGLCSALVFLLRFLLNKGFRA